MNLCHVNLKSFSKQKNQNPKFSISLNWLGIYYLRTWKLISFFPILIHKRCPLSVETKDMEAYDPRSRHNNN